MYSIPVFGNKAKPARILGEPKKPEGLIERLLDSFLLSVTCRGNIVLVSGSIEKYLGHCRVSLFVRILLLLLAAVGVEMEYDDKSCKTDDREMHEMQAEITTCCC